jgi:Ca-activated chloride channel homolog
VRPVTVRAAFIAGALIAAAAALGAQQPPVPSRPQDEGRDGPRFKSGVELVNVTATVSDSSGRFVSGLQQEDFAIYENGQRQDVVYFSPERVPVSLGIVLDTSGSMAGDKIGEARAALDRFVYELLDERDEVFLYRFSDRPVLLQDWTTDRAQLTRAMSRIVPNGGTAMYDAVLEAIPLAEQGHHQKKAIVVISDGNDTSSAATLRDVRDRLRGTDVLVYALGIDGESAAPFSRPPARPRLPFPFPPGGPRRPGGRFPFSPQVFGPGTGGGGGRRLPPRPGGDARVNADALREMTSDSGGRTEVVRSAGDLGPATVSIADELSKQYALGYASTLKKDGLWHSIFVEVRDRAYRVRARRGYVAS